MAIIIGGGSGNAISIASNVGSANQVITSDGTNSSWTPGGATIQVSVTTFTSPGTFTKPATAGLFKVTVVGAGGQGSPNFGSPGAAGGGGGGGGAAIKYITAPLITGPVAVTAGPGTNSFGSFCSATSGSPNGNGSVIGGPGGAGSSGDINIEGGRGYSGTPRVGPTGPVAFGGSGGSSILGGGAAGGTAATNPAPNATGIGGGGGGAGSVPNTNAQAGSGANGIVIVEIFG
jgi:hypothetical protein